MSLCPRLSLSPSLPPAHVSPKLSTRAQVLVTRRQHGGGMHSLARVVAAAMGQGDLLQLKAGLLRRRQAALLVPYLPTRQPDGLRLPIRVVQGHGERGPLPRCSDALLWRQCPPRGHLPLRQRQAVRRRCVWGGVCTPRSKTPNLISVCMCPTLTGLHSAGPRHDKTYLHFYDKPATCRSQTSSYGARPALCHMPRPTRELTAALSVPPRASFPRSLSQGAFAAYL